MTTVVVAARIILVALFAVAGIAKLANLSEWRKTLLLVGVPARRIGAVALLVPIAELAIAGALSLNATTRWGAVAALVALVAFSLVISISVLRHRTPDCNCFGSLGARPLGWGTVGRNVLFAGLAGLIIWSPDFALSAAAIVGMVATVAFAVQAWFGFQLLQQNGRLLARVDALEAGEPPARGLAPGVPAPVFAAQDPSGATLHSEDIWRGAPTTLLAFIAADCPACDEVLPDLSRWQHERVNFNVAVVTSGDPEPNLRKLAGADFTALAMQRSSEITDAYRVPGTPAALLVDADGVIKSEVVLGAGAIRKLANGRPSPVPEPTSAAPEKLGPALPSPAVAGAGATAVLLAGAATASARADDPGIAAIQATLNSAGPTIVADLEGLKKGFLRSIGSKTKQATSAAHAAISKQRNHLLELRAALAALVVDSAEAQATRDSGIASIDHQVAALNEFDHLIDLRSKAARKRSEKKANRLLQLARQSGYYLNVGLGCTGSEC